MTFQNTVYMHRSNEIRTLTIQWEVTCAMWSVTGPPRSTSSHSDGVGGWIGCAAPFPVYSSLSGSKGSFSLSLTFTSRVAPAPSLVVYAIFPSGGVVADKIQFSVEMCFDNQVKWRVRRVKKRAGLREGACVCWGCRQTGSGSWLLHCIYVFNVLDLCWNLSCFFFLKSCSISYSTYSFSFNFFSSKLSVSLYWAAHSFHTCHNVLGLKS
jgi:hypothetical protein